MVGKYLNPKADLTFKLVFAEHKDLMMSLLNALLPLAEDAPITSLEYLTPELVPEKPAKKNSIVDVRCKDSLGRQFIVEMQMHWDDDFKKRVLLNASKAIVRQADRGDKDRAIEPVFSLNLLNDDAFMPQAEEFYHSYAIVNVEHPDRSIEGLSFVFIELPKFQPKSMLEKKMAVLWLRFLTEINEDTREAPRELLFYEETSKALGIVEKSAMSDAQLYAYEEFMLAIEDEQVLREGALKRGLQEGLAKGMEEGLAKGMEEGLTKGRAEEKAKAKQEKLETARKLKAMNLLTIAQIADATGLSVEEIESLL